MFVKEFVKTVMIVRVMDCNLYFLRYINKKVITLYIFNEKKNFVNLVQLYMTVARMNLAESLKDPCETYLNRAEEVAELLGNPEKLTNSIEEMRKTVERIDKI